MNWLHELVGDISQFDASQEERVALVSLANALQRAALETGLEIPKPRLARTFTMPSLMWVHRTSTAMARDHQYYDLRFCIEDPYVPQATAVVTAYKEKQEFTFRNPNLCERLRTFFSYLPK